MGNRLNFDEAYDFIQGIEGGYSNHKNDRGGKTNYGVTQYTYDLYNKSKGRSSKDVRFINQQEAKNVYKEIFWDNSKSSKITDPEAALIYFDTAVNSGEGEAKRLYQNSGGNTDRFIEERRNNYKRIIDNDPTQKVFEKGWGNRVDQLETEVNKRRNKTSGTVTGGAAPLDSGFNKIPSIEEIDSWSTKKFRENEKQVDEWQKNGQLKYENPNKWDKLKSPKQWFKW